MPDNTTPRTKEEILRQEYEKMFGAQKYDRSVSRKMNFDYVSSAMDEYAKQKCIELLNWMYAGAAETIPSMGRNSGTNMWRRDLDTQYKDSAAIYEAFLTETSI